MFLSSDKRSCRRLGKFSIQSTKSARNGLGLTTVSGLAVNLTGCEMGCVDDGGAGGASNELTPRLE